MHSHQIIIIHPPPHVNFARKVDFGLSHLFELLLNVGLDGSERRRNFVHQLADYSVDEGGLGSETKEISMKNFGQRPESKTPPLSYHFAEEDPSHTTLPKKTSSWSPMEKESLSVPRERLPIESKSTCPSFSTTWESEGGGGVKLHEG